MIAYTVTCFSLDKSFSHTIILIKISMWASKKCHTFNLLCVLNIFSWGGHQLKLISYRALRRLLWTIFMKIKMFWICSVESSINYLSIDFLYNIKAINFSSVTKLLRSRSHWPRSDTRHSTTSRIIYPSIRFRFKIAVTSLLCAILNHVLIYIQNMKALHLKTRLFCRGQCCIRRRAFGVRQCLHPVKWRHM